MSLSERAKSINERPADLIADVTLYKTENGGRKGPAPPGWGCPTKTSKDSPGWDAWPQLGDEWLQLGEKRRVGFVFLSPEGAETMRRAGSFYLWELGLIGEAEVVDS
ncbi:MAG TPA: hypothetical protein VK485_06200 [Sphingomicrobium sp.]|nr:hypothetical protein [Sphingomicrobium sp.]